MPDMDKQREAEPQADGPSFDERLGRLEEIVAALEDGKLELEPSIEKYKEGVALLRDCQELLAGYRRQVEELSRDASQSLRPLAGDPDVEGAESRV